MLRNLIIVLLSVVCLASCRTYYPTTTNTQQSKDSIRKEYVHDSVFVEKERRIYLQGDTILIHDTVTVTREKRTLIHDSIYVHRTDTIYQTAPAPREKNTCDKPFLHRSGIALWVILSILFVAVICGIVFRFARR